MNASNAAGDFADSASAIPQPRRPVSGGLIIMAALLIVAGVVGAVLLSNRENNPLPVDGDGTAAANRADGAGSLTPSADADDGTSAAATESAMIGVGGTEERHQQHRRYGGEGDGRDGAHERTAHERAAV